MLLHVDETPSTNDLIRQLHAAERLAEGSVVACRAQTKGRGQLNNSWEAEPGKNLTFSMLLHPTFVRPSEQFVISQAVALGVVDLLDQFSDGFSVKWPNDIYWNKKKIAGILIENDLGGGIIQNTIIGIGLNINQELFRSNAPNPVSLKQITGKEHNLDELLAQLTQALLVRYAQLVGNDRATLHHDYLRRLFRGNTPALYRDAHGTFTATIETVKPSGHLIVRDTDQQPRCYTFKEIEFIL